MLYFFPEVGLNSVFVAIVNRLCPFPHSKLQAKWNSYLVLVLMLLLTPMLLVLWTWCEWQSGRAVRPAVCGPQGAQQL
jgi:hypothetical protein